MWNVVFIYGNLRLDFLSLIFIDCHFTIFTNFCEGRHIMPRRRQKGEGSITEYRKGHFRAFLDLGRDPKTNKRIRKTFTGNSKAEVVAKLNKAKYEKQEGILKVNNQTPLIAKGIKMKTVSERLGHSSITITMDRYTHGVLEEDKKAAKVIDKITEDV